MPGCPPVLTYTTLHSFNKSGQRFAESKEGRANSTTVGVDAYPDTGTLYIYCASVPWQGHQSAGTQSLLSQGRQDMTRTWDGPPERIRCVGLGRPGAAAPAPARPSPAPTIPRPAAPARPPRGRHALRRVRHNHLPRRAQRVDNADDGGGVTVARANRRADRAGPGRSSRLQRAR